jgi:hypothetical protein
VFLGLRVLGLRSLASLLKSWKVSRKAAGVGQIDLAGGCVRVSLWFRLACGSQVDLNLRFVLMCQLSDRVLVFGLGACV